MLNNVKISEDTERKNVYMMSFIMKKLMKLKINLENFNLIVLKYLKN